MDNQEAIKELSEWLDGCCGGEEIEPTRQALRLAISALQAQEAKTQLSAEGTTSDLISRQDAIDVLGVFTQADALGHTPKQIVEALPSAQPEIEERKEESAQNVPKEDLISRKAAIDAVENIDCSDGVGISALKCEAVGDVVTAIKALPSAQPTLCGYDIEHLILIANVLRKENLPPERIIEALTDIGRIVSIVTDEFEESLRKAVEQCKI